MTLIYYVTLSYDLDLGFSRSNFEKAVFLLWDGHLTRNKKDVCWRDVGPTFWLWVMILTLDFQGEIVPCSRKTFMVHQIFVWWALYILFKFVKFLIRHLGLAFGNVRWFSWTLEILKKIVLLEWGGRLTKNEKMWVNRKSDPLCTFELWPYPWPWPWIFKVKFKKKNYIRNGRVDWQETKWIWVNRMLNSLYDLELLVWPCIFK